MWRFMIVTFAFLGWSFYELSGGSDYTPVETSLQAQAAQTAVDVTPLETVETKTQASTNAAAQPQPEAQTIAASTLAELQSAEQQGERFEITLASAPAGEGYVSRSLPDTVKADMQNGYISRSFPDTVKSENIRSVSSAIDAAVAQAQADIAAAEQERLEAEERREAAMIENADGEEVFSLETYVQARQMNASLVVDEETYLERVNSASSLDYGGDADIRFVTGDVVNVRSGPGTAFEAVGKLTGGTEVIVIDEPGNGWVLLEVAETGETGWMADWLVTAAN